jgi:hypothetical protein
MDRQLIPRAILALLTVLSLFAVIVSLHTNGSSGQSTRPKAFGAPSFGFAGYSDVATVEQISARWRVPFLDTKSTLGSASTWIAAQSFDGHFIQLGTTEDSGFGAPSIFRVFWSDPVVQFHPQSLGTVAAGNLITYSMTKTSAGWTLRFDDRTTSMSNQVTIPYGGTTLFNEGEWIQEDPTYSNFNVHVPYPNMSLVTFSHLKLNQQVPQLSYQYAQVMSTSNGIFLIPSKVQHDHFTFHHAKGVALQYLRDALPLNSALYPFDTDAQNNVTPSSLTKRELVFALGAFVSDLKSQRWPKATHSDIAGIVTGMKSFKKLVQRWPVAPAKLPPQDYSELQNLGASNRVFTLDIHARLGLPPRD